MQKRIFTIFELITKLKQKKVDGFDRALTALRGHPATFADIVAEYIADKREAAYILFYNKSTIIAMCRILLGLPSDGYINMVYVSQAFRGRGYCKQLLKFAIKKTKLKRYHLDVERDNAAAIKCYEHLGFVIAKTTKNEYRMVLKK